MIRAACAALAIGFTPAAALAVTFSFDDGGGNGTFTDLTDPGGFFDIAFNMTGSNTGGFSSVVTSYSGPNDGAKPLNVSGQFGYLTNDFDGPEFDPFGYLIDAQQFQLTDDNGPGGQSGIFAFVVNPGEQFGWYIDAIDDQLGAASVTVGADLAPVPLPGGLPLALIGFAALAGLVSVRRTA
jgi:hypothetical protein